MRKLSKLIICLSVLLFTVNLMAEPTVVVMPITAKKRTRFVQNIDENFKLLYGSIRGINAEGYKGRLAGRIHRCRSKYRCLKKMTAKVGEFVLISRFRVIRGVPEVVLYIMSNGKRIGKEVVKGERDIDEEDMAAEILAGANALVKNVNFDGGSGIAQEERVEKPESKTLSAHQKRGHLRKGFQAYKKGDIKGAMKFFIIAGNDDMGEKARDVSELINRAREKIKSGEYESAIDMMKDAGEKDYDIRKAGYKALQFIKETKKHKHYRMFDGDDKDVFERIHKSFLRDIERAEKWKKREKSKLRERYGADKDFREKLTKEYEQREEKIREKQKKEEEKNRELIEKYQKKLSNLDEKYEDKIRDAEGEIQKIYKKIQEGAGPEEMFREEIKNDYKAIERKYQNLIKNAEKKKSDAIRNAKTFIKQLENDVEKQMKNIENKSRDLEKQLEKLSVEIEKDREKFERGEVKIQEQFEIDTSKLQEKNAKDIEDVEREQRKKITKLNLELRKYDKKIENADRGLDQYQAEIDQYIEKQERRLQMIQQKADRAREKIDREFQEKRRKVEEKAEQEYQKQVRAYVRDIEGTEEKILRFEEKHPMDFDKKREYKNLQNMLRKATGRLSKFEQGYNDFLKKATRSVRAEYENNLKKLDRSLDSLRKKVKGEINAFARKKNNEKKAAMRQARILKKGRRKFEKRINWKIAVEEKERAKKIKAIEARMVIREKKRIKDAKIRRARFEKSIARKKRQLTKMEKALAIHGRRSNKRRTALSKKLEKARIGLDKKMSAIEIGYQKTRERLELAAEKERNAVFRKYQKLAKRKKAGFERKIKALEAKMRGIINQRKKEAAILRANIKKLESKSIAMQKAWEKAARKRAAALKWKIESTEKKIAKNANILKRKEQQVEKQYDAKINAIVRKEIAKVKARFKGKKMYKTKRERDVAYSSLTDKINWVKAEAYAYEGRRLVKEKKLRDALQMFYKSFYYVDNNKVAIGGIKMINDAAEKEFRRAYNLVEEDPSEAKDIAEDLMEKLSPNNEFYIRSRILIDQLD